MRCRRLSAAALAGTLLIIAAPGTSTAAGPDCQVIDPETGRCLVVVAPEPPRDDDGTDGRPIDTGSGSACFVKPELSEPFGRPGGPVPCTDGDGAWSNSLQCYVALLDPQPLAGDPYWRGHEPGDGAVYRCWQPWAAFQMYVWRPTPPDVAAAGPSPREVAELAVDQMDLHAITIGITPEPGPGSIGLVGMPVWMWAADPGPSTVGPITATASSGGVTVTATATLHQITWDMGDGTTVVCTGPGTPYTPSRGTAQSPDCGHTYTTTSDSRPGDVFTVSATSDWVVSWAGAGQTGTIRLDGLTQSAQIAVGEAQVLVTS